METLAASLDWLLDTHDLAEKRFGNPERPGSPLKFPLANLQSLALMNIGYLLVLGALVVYMKTRETPFELRTFRFVYNCICTGLSAYTAYSYLAFVYRQRYGFVCSNTEGEFHDDMLWINYIFYLSKFFEFADTMIMALRKSFRQITFLHVVHHTSITAVVFCYLKFSGGGDEWFPACLNSIVHVVMYGHYALVTLGYESFWKRYITQFQLTQFLLIFIQNAAGFYFRCGGEFLNVVQCMYMTLMVALFADFYARAYLGKRNAKAKPKQT